MKNLKMIILPAVVLIAGVSAAFATAETKDRTTVLETGYYFNNSAPVIKCISTNVQCSPIVSAATCQWTSGGVTHNLQRYVNDSSCGMNLYKP